MGTRTLGFVVVSGLAFACSKAADNKAGPANAAPAKPNALTDKPQANPFPPAKPGCKATVMSLANQWIDKVGARQLANYKPGTSKLTQASFEALPNPPDLDGDGRKDFVMRYRSGLKNPSHYFYVYDKQGCPSLVGVLTLSPLFGFSCGTRQPGGYCDIHASRLMIHGEPEHSVYRFDGKWYELHGRPRLGPRPTKFRPKPKQP